MRLSLAILFLALLLPVAAGALEVPPPPSTPVLDEAGLLGDATRRGLANAIARFEAESSNQIAVAIFPSLDGESLEDFTIRLAEAWQPGQAERDNGVILAIFVEDRKVRIEVGYGLEGALPDAIAARIIRQVIAPAFRAGDYDRGVTAAVEAIMQATRGEYEGLEEDDDSGGTGAVLFFFLLMVAFSLMSRLQRRARGYSRGGVFPVGGGFFGGGGGGGGGGFGGGGFGGGGSSGGW